MRLSAAVIILLFVGGCSSSSFLGKRFDNFTAYYNTFYNARKSFETASKTVKRSDTKIDRDVYLSVFEVANTGQGTRDFENTIKKSADVLRNHPQSKWVDDALLLIGKSYYYMANTVGAEQKFREVIDRASALEDEARFWLGLTLIASGAYDEAGEHLSESIERENVNPRWRSKMQVALGELYVRQEAWPEAAEALRAGTAEIKDNELGGRAAFLLGQVYETLGEFGLAADAYYRVRKFNPVYELSYASRYNAARVEGLHGDVDAALKDVRRMERDGKNFAYRAEIAFLRGQILQAAGYIPDADQVYRDILYDSDANITTVRGPVHYQLGTIYRDDLIDFTLAAAHFDTAATVLKGVASRNQALSGRTEQYRPAPGAIIDAADQAEVFGTYATLWERVAHYDSLLYLGSLDDEAFSEKIKEIRRQMADELLEQRRLQRQRSVAAGFDRSGAIQEGPAPPSAQQATGPSSTAGFLFHRDRSRVQEGLISFFDRWGERPLVPNWRRQAAIAGQGEAESDGTGDSSAALATGLPVDASLSAEAVAASVEVDVSAVPRTEEARAKLRTERAAARYELANVLFLSVELPDSAAAWYRRVVDEDAETDVAARALYALAEVQLSLGDGESAEAIYKQVAAKYPDSDVANRAADRTGIQVPGSASVDEREAGAEQYRAAFGLWTEGRLLEAMESMLELAADYPEIDVGGRALLAASAIYLEWADSTETDPLDPIAIGVDPTYWSALGLVASVDTNAATNVGAGSQQHDPDTFGATPDVRDKGLDGDVPRPDTLGAPTDTLQESGPRSAEFLRGEDATALADIAVADTVDAQLDSVGTARRTPLRRDVAGAVGEDGTPPVPGSSMDSLKVVAPDSLKVDAPDSLKVVGSDSLKVDAPDSLKVVAPDSLKVDATTDAAASPPGVRLEQLYDAVAARHPNTEYANRASALKNALTQMRQERDAAAAVAQQAEEPAPPTGEPIAETPGRDRPLVEADSVAADSEPISRRALSKEMAGEVMAAEPRTGELDEQVVDSARVRVPPEPQAPVTNVATAVDTEPIPVGGPGAMQRMVRYPQMAREAGVTGEVVVTFIVDLRGQVRDERIVKGLGYGCDQEALRVISRTRYRPAMKDGRPVAYRMQTAVAFGSSEAAPVSE